MAIGPMNSTNVLASLTGARPSVGIPTGPVPTQAIETLQQIAGKNLGLKKGAVSAFDIDEGAIPQLTPQGSLPSPFQSLMQAVISGNPEVLQKLGQLPPEQIEALVKRMSSTLSERGFNNVGSNASAATGGSIVPDALSARGSAQVMQNMAAVFGQGGLDAVANDILSRAGINPAAIGSTQSAATAATNGGDFESGLLSNINGPPPMPANVKDERQMLEYQRAMQLYTAMVQMITQVMQMLHEARKNIIQNLRA